MESPAIPVGIVATIANHNVVGLISSSIVAMRAELEASSTNIAFDHMFLGVHEFPFAYKKKPELRLAISELLLQLFKFRFEF